MSVPLTGVSKPIIQIKELIQNVAKSCINVLITGETGVGKEVIAKNLYAASPRSHNNFVKINCAALPETLLESELYGYEKGAFTGADKNRSGKFQTADKGVLFLDEIGDMPVSLQSKMLHVLQSGEFSPLGSDHDRKTDVWVIAATNTDLESRIAKKTFREDLFYRLNTINIEIPPLRERREDIPYLVHYFYKMNQAANPGFKGEPPDSKTMTRLCEYPWPGNVRQLKNTIKKQMVLNSWENVFDELPREPEEGYAAACNLNRNIGLLKNEDIHDGTLAGNKKPQAYPARLDLHVMENRLRIISQFIDISTSSEKLFEDLSLKKIKKQASSRVEKELIRFTLNQVGWNKSHAARLLKISYKALLYKTREFDIHPAV